MKLDKNYWSNVAKRNRKRNKGLSFFTNTNAGNVELNQAMFNHSMDINGDFCSADGGNAISESLDADSLGMIETAVRNVDGVELTIKKDTTNPKGEDEYFLIVDSWGDLNDLIMEMGLTDENELSDIIEWGFSDEWATCDHCGRAVRTQADGAFWKPDYWADYNHGELICGDCLRGSEEEKKNYLDYLTNNPERANTILSNKELETSGYKKLNTEDYANGWYGKKIDRVLSSTETDSEGNEYHVAKLFFGKAPDSVVLTGDEAEKYINHWKQYADDPDKYKEYADKQGRYVRIHEGGEGRE